MDKLLNLKKTLEKDYIYRNNLLHEREIIRHYIRLIDDPYLKYSDNEEGFISVFDILGIRIKEISSTMVEIIGFYDDRERVLKSGDIIISVNNTNPYKCSFLLNSSNTDNDKIKIVAIRNLNNNKVNLIQEVYSIPIINTQTKEITFCEDNINSIFYLHLLDCNGDMEKYVNKSLQYKKLILDLRNNLGGSVKKMYQILSLLCQDGQIAYIKKDSNHNLKIMKTKSNNHIKHEHISIIVNRYTMSSAELLAVSLRDNNDAVIIGEKSFGKAIMTEQYVIDEKSYVMIPKYIFLSPKGEDINHKGILPDILYDSNKIDQIIYEKKLNMLINLKNSLTDVN